MYLFFAVLLVIVGVFMVLAVLVQNSKGGGLAANFASGNQTFGVRQTADYIEKITWYLCIALFVCCFAATASIPRNVVTENRSAVQERAQGVTPGTFNVTGTPTALPTEGNEQNANPTDETAGTPAPTEQTQVPATETEVPASTQPENE